MIELDQPAPFFSGKIDTGEEFNLNMIRGITSVLYFYPKDDTPGCTKEAIAFSERIEDYEKLGVRIIGVSKDTIKKHCSFKSKYDLKITLISDEDGNICENYGVWVEKNMYGRKYMGIERTTFLIDDNGIVKNIWRKVKVPGHADAVLTTIKNVANE